MILVDKNFKYDHLYTIGLEKNNEGKRNTKRLTSGEFHINSFNWSPDGTTLAFSHAPTPTINDNLWTDISSVPSDSGMVTALVTRPGVDTNPIYSPDGKWIAFESHGGQPERVGLSDIYKIPNSGGNPIALQQTPDRNGSIVGWSQDGNHLFVSETFKTSQTLYAVPSSNNAKPLKGDYIAYSDSKLPILTSLKGTGGNFSVSKAGNMSYSYEDSDTPVEVFTSGLKGEAGKKLSAVNDGFEAPALGKTELISWKSKDGMQIEGLLTYPVGYKPGTKYPIILEIHGGPAGVFRKSYTGSQ